MIKQLDTIKLARDIPEHRLKKGMLGVVVSVFTEPILAYEVEFADDQGRTFAELAIEPQDLILVKAGSNT